MRTSSFFEITNKKLNVITDIASAYSSVFATPPLVIVGSAISCMPPTSKPAGQNISHEIVDLLLEKNRPYITHNSAPLFKRVTDEISWSVLFEQCFERAPNIDSLRTIINYFFLEAKPNRYHEILAKALTNGLISGILTTNYDNCLDKCFASFAGNNVLTISDEEDLLSMADNKILYFKIHGSCKNSRESNICLALSDESKLVEWKKDLLSQMIEKKTILFIAYSGLDFEICQEIINNRNVEKVFWLVRPEKNWEELNPNQIKILEHFNGEILLGDMFEVFHLMDNSLQEQLTPDRYAISIEEGCLRKQISDITEKNQFRIWLVSLLNSMGYAILANRLALKLSFDCLLLGSRFNTLRYTADEQTAHSAYKIGKYRQANAFFFISCLRTRRDDFQLVLLLLDFFENARTGYFLVSAALLMKLCEWIVHRQDFLDNLDSRKMNMLLGRFYGRSLNYHKTKARIYKTMNIKKKLKIENAYIEELVNKAKESTASAGDWIYNSAVQANSNPEVPTYEETIHSFVQSGTYFEAVYSFRKRLLRKVSISESEIERLNNHIATCHELGLLPERWKLLWTKTKLTGEKTEWRKAVIANQYSILGYCALLIFPEIFIT